MCEATANVVHASNIINLAFAARFMFDACTPLAVASTFAYYPGLVSKRGHFLHRVNNVASLTL